MLTEEIDKSGGREEASKRSHNSRPSASKAGQEVATTRDQARTACIRQWQADKEDSNADLASTLKQAHCVGRAQPPLSIERRDKSRDVAYVYIPCCDRRKQHATDERRPPTDFEIHRY
jgi:hypothetical protein